MSEHTCRGRWLLWAFAALLVAVGPPLSAGTLLCTKGAPPDDEARKVAAKVFPDELPRVSAIEKARSRGRERDGRTTIRLLAIRVAFQPDTDPRSTGDGTFDLSEWDGQTFDGPPHDREYFELHMTALENYYESVSYGALDIEFAVAPAGSAEAYVLPHEMGYYHDYSEEQVWYVSQVEAFTRDAFAAADTTDTLDFSRYDGYVLFHAGADWQSDVNLDSPFDLPSAHISLGEPILVNDGAWEIWDAAIIPETSSQDGLTIVLNGTLAHEVGHILGLPDLYNTSNFFPAIGYWGIMDSGGRIGMNTPWGWAYGVIPAAPCAWSKEYLGWLDPVVILADADDVEVKASVLRGPGCRLFKIPVTSDEYFLLENRLDDIGGDFTVAIEQERGVVLGPVDPHCTEDICPINHEYDFLLPGPGLIIYHVDNTRVIPGLMPYDTINADRHRRGVAIEEADGIMDLGDVSSFYWAGSKYDPFFAANNDSFSWDTFPSTDNNTGGKTYLAVTRISDPDTVMTARVTFDRWKDGWPVDIAEPIGRASPRVADLDGDGAGEVVVAAASGNVYAWHADGSPVIPLCEVFGLFARAPGGVSRTPAVADIDRDGNLEVIVASDAGSLYVWSHEDLDHDGLADLHAATFPVWLDGAASAAPLAANMAGGEELEIVAASDGGWLTIVDADGAEVGASPYGFGHLVLDDVSLAAADLDGDGLSEVALSTTNRGWVAALNADGSPLSGWPVSVEAWVSESAELALGDIDRAPDGFPEIVAAGSDGIVHVWDRRGLELEGWPRDLGRAVESRPSIADLDGDGYLEVVVSAGSSKVVGLRSNGTLVENWPLRLSAGDSLVVNRSAPVIGDLDGDGDLDVVAQGPDGNVFAWDAVTGDMEPGWPLSSDPPSGTPWIGDIEGDGEMDLLVAGDGGRVLLYALPYDCVPGAVVWPTEGGSASGAGAYPDSLVPEPPEEGEGLLDAERTYCYPNPAKGTDLTIRVYLEQSADLKVVMMDVTGQVVHQTELEGVPTVNEIVWDTERVASGLYLVRVEAVEPRGRTVPLGADRRRSEVKIMKVAVVR